MRISHSAGLNADLLKPHSTDDFQPQKSEITKTCVRPNAPHHRLPVSGALGFAGVLWRSSLLKMRGFLGYEGLFFIFRSTQPTCYSAWHVVSTIPFITKINIQWGRGKSPRSDRTEKIERYPSKKQGVLFIQKHPFLSNSR